MIWFLLACAAQAPDPTVAAPEPPVQPVRTSFVPPERAPDPTVFADVDSVLATGNPGAYRFGVAVLSPDQGCDHYADWWEVVGADGQLLYRRILGHSHVEEQPFSRAGGPVQIDPDEVVWVRAHMHPSGYGGRVLKGSVSSGFSYADDLPTLWHAQLADVPPLPNECAW